MRAFVLAMITMCFASAAMAQTSVTATATVTPPSPVQIDLCRLDYNTGGAGGLGLLGALSAMSKSTGQLKIKFTNESEREVSVVRFAVDLEGKAASIRDVGKFAPGVTVDHGFKDFAGSTQWVFSRQQHPTCHVSYVKFSDGTAWSLPDAPAELTSPAPVSSAAPVTSPAPVSSAAP
jgi:hypothetical protein